MSSSPVKLHAPDVEEAVLAAVLRDKHALYQVVDQLTAAAFHDLRHRRIWEAITWLYAHDKPVDISTVSVELELQGHLNACGGRSEIARISEVVFTSVNAPAHARILLDYQKRRAISEFLRGEDIKIADDPRESLARLEAGLQAIAECGGESERTSDEQINRMMAADYEILEGRLAGANWPLPELSQLTRGIRPGKIYLIIALFKTGKSKLAIATIHQLITDRVPCLFLSLEMGSTQVLHWLAACALSIDASLFGSPRISRRQIEDAHHWVQEHCADGQLVIDDRAVQTPETICRAMRQAALARGVKVVFIDYLQRISWAEGTASVSDIARGLSQIAATAKRFNLAVVGLSQVPKGVEQRGGGQLINLSDVKDAAAYAEVADCSIAITDPNRHQPSPVPQRHLRFLVEQRDGESKIIDVQADLRYGHFHALIATDEKTAVFPAAA